MSTSPSSTIPLSILDRHVREHLVGRQFERRRWNLGPAPVLWPELYVLHGTPEFHAGYDVFVSIGAANLRDGHHREFVLISPYDDEACVETLFMVAHYHHHQGLDVGHTLPIGRPWFPGSSCDHFLVSMPYPFGPELERLSHNGHEIRFLWLLPVYQSEARFRHDQGIDALEELFDQAAFEICDLDRPPVV